MNSIIPAFFDKHVKERREIDVVKKAKAYPAQKMRFLNS